MKMKEAGLAPADQEASKRSPLNNLLVFKDQPLFADSKAVDEADAFNHEAFAETRLICLSHVAIFKPHPRPAPEGLGVRLPLIRHTVRTAAAPVGALAVAMIQPAFRALLMPAIGRPALPPARFLATAHAAVAVAAVAVYANPEHRPAARITANSMPKNNFPTNRHPPQQAAFDKGNGSCQGKTNSMAAFVGMKAADKEPRCSNSGVLFYRLLPKTPYNFRHHRRRSTDDRASGADD